MSNKAERNRVPVWSPDWDVDTLALAYQAAQGTHELVDKWASALDAKVVAVFGVSSAILTIGPGLGQGLKAGLASFLWALAAVCWAVGTLFCYRAYGLRSLRVGVDPVAFLDPAWLSLTPTEFRLYRLQKLGQSFAENRVVLDAKAGALGWAIHLTAAEVALIVIAIALTKWA